MAGVRYVRMDPSGNVTCLVLDPVKPEDRAAVTGELMERCEQVGYLMPVREVGIRGRLEMMGGEFCGNASMAAAAYLASRDGLAEGQEAEILLEVSGAEEPVACRIRREGDQWSGRVRMPLPGAVEPREIRGCRLTAVRLPGMTHLVFEGGALERREAEEILRAAQDIFGDPAIGLLQWRREAEDLRDPAGEGEMLQISGSMLPLVWVRESGTMVWENACGSGTLAAACLESLREGRSLRCAVCQPGGTLRAEIQWDGKRIREAWLLGTVREG